MKVINAELRLPPQIEVEHVTCDFNTKSFAPVRALEDASLSVGAGEFVAFVGPSGCGKSTLLHMIAGLLRPSAGSIRFKGQPVAGVNTSVGYLTQFNTLLPWRTVAGNLRLPLELRRVPRSQHQELVDRYVRLVSLDGFANHYLSQLSGGMRQRASLARTLIYGADTLLMDEPFAALDALLRLEMQSELLRVWELERKTVVFVTHDLPEAITLADRVILFSGRPGHVKAEYTIDLPRPRSATTIRFDPAFVKLEAELWQQLDRTPGVTI
jgi:NitT/TauT family transport system ATP-binding protein